MKLIEVNGTLKKHFILTIKIYSVYKAEVLQDLYERSDGRQTH